jgi:hypothetical protein
MPSSRKLRRAVQVTRAATLCAALAPIVASAQPALPAPPASAPEASPPGLWINCVHLWAQIQGGIMGKPSGPSDGLNFGRLFDDHANQFQLNQILLTANRPLDLPNRDFTKRGAPPGADLNILQAFSEACRSDLLD